MQHGRNVREYGGQTRVVSRCGVERVFLDVTCFAFIENEREERKQGCNYLRLMRRGGGIPIRTLYKW